MYNIVFMYMSFCDLFFAIYFLHCVLLSLNVLQAGSLLDYMALLYPKLLVMSSSSFDCKLFRILLKQFLMVELFVSLQKTSGHYAQVCT